MANEPKKQIGTDPNRPGQPRQNPSGGSNQPGRQENPGNRRSDEWSDKGTRPSNPNDPSRRPDDDDDMDESENPA